MACAVISRRDCTGHPNEEFTTRYERDTDIGDFDLFAFLLRFATRRDLFIRDRPWLFHGVVDTKSVIKLRHLGDRLYILYTKTSNE